ncbi:MAG: hypothetical protein ACRDYY_14435, partial [Acidimicrobiales bacterium]
PLVWIFGPHIAVLNIWTCVIGFGGLLSTDYLLRRAGAGRWAALTIAAALSAGPMYSALAVSFMTDIPSYAVMMTALAVAVSDSSTGRLLTRRSAIALLLGAVAFTIREPAGVAFVAVAAGRVWCCRRRSLTDLLRWGGTVAIIGLGALVFYVWRRGLPTTGYEAPPSLSWGQLWNWYSQQWLLPLLGLMLLMPVMVSRPMAAVRAAWRNHRGAVAALWLALAAGPWVIRYAAFLRDLTSGATYLTHVLVPPLGNWYFGNTGDAGMLPPIVPTWGIGALAMVSTLVWIPISAYLVLAWSRWRSERSTSDGSQASYAALLAFIGLVGSILLVALMIVTQEQMWDRYLFPLAGTTSVVVAYASQCGEMAAVPVLRRSLRISVVAIGAAAFLGIAVASLAYTTAMNGWDGSEWAYSEAFARTVSQVPPKYLFTNWLWNSVQAGIYEEPVYGLDPSYRPCWSEVATNSPTRWTPSNPTNPQFLRVYRNWVVTYRYQMEPYDGASARPVCHLSQGGSAPRRGGGRTSR